MYFQRYDVFVSDSESSDSAVEHSGDEAGPQTSSSPASSWSEESAMSRLDPQEFHAYTGSPSKSVLFP